MGKDDRKTPQRPTVVHRERLLRRLNRIVSPGIVVVSAQAAQGKSTLIDDYTTSTGAHACWVRLRPQDAIVENFHRRLQEAVRRHGWLPSTEARADPSNANAAASVVQERIVDLLHRLPSDLHLVFDNWHHLGPRADDTPWIETLLAACPREGRLYLLSREKVAVHLQRRRIRRQALLITGEELAFTQAEIETFLTAIAGANVGGHHSRLAHEVTAGWAGGLVLLVEALHRQHGDAREFWKPPTLSNRLHAETAGFFREEVYGHQAPGMKRFLTLAALLETVSADLMRAQLGRREADRFYREAERQNLFLQALEDEAATWRFRLNPLFRGFLLAEGRTLLSEGTMGAFMKKAGRRFEAAGDPATAVTCFLKAGDTRAAAVAVTRIGFQLSVEGRFAEIDAWTAMLPPVVLKDDPWLTLLKAMTYRIRGGQRTIRELNVAKARFDRNGHLRESMFALAYLIETAAFIGHDSEHRSQWIAEAEALLRAASHKPHFSYAKALLWQQIGFGAATASIVDLQKSLSACQNAVILGKRIDAPRLVANALTVAAHAHVLAGEFEQARSRLQMAAAYDSEGTFPEYGALQALTRIRLELIAGRFDSAAKRLKRLAADIDTFGLIILYPAYIEASGLLQIYRQQYAALEKTLQHMRDVAILLNNTAHSARAAWLSGLGGYHQGRFRRARNALRPALDAPELPATDQARLQELAGFIALNRGRLKAAATRFKDALAFFEHAGMPLATCETRLGMALAQHARQDEAAARDNLQAAFRGLADASIDHLPTIRPADLARACVLALELEIPSAAEQARNLLATRLSKIQPRIPAPASSQAPRTDAVGQRGSRRALYRTGVPVITIRTFGGFEVLRDGTHPVTAGGWEGSRPAMLLKAILVHGSRHIPKEILIEELWPDQTPEKSFRNFKVTLHRLRKRLEPEMTSAMGSAYIHLKDHLLSLDAHLCQVDTTAFYHLCKKVRRSEPEMDRETLLELVSEAESVYRGDFLPEEPYLNWAEMKRSALREEFIQLMYRLGRLFGHQASFREARRCYRHILRIDPAQEKAQRRLMRLLARDGRSGEAVRLYRDFKTYLDTEIGAIPDETTTDLYRSICTRRHRPTGAIRRQPR